MTIAITLEIEDARRLGASVPKAVDDAEKALQVVQERLTDRGPLGVLAKLRTAAPKDVDAVLVELSAAYAQKLGLGEAQKYGALKAVEDRLTDTWAAARDKVIADLVTARLPLVAEINELAARVPVALARDLNSATAPGDALTQAVRLRTALAELMAVTRFTSGPAVAQKPGESWGRALGIVLNTSVPAEYAAVYGLERALNKLGVLTPEGAVVVRQAGYEISILPTAEAVQRLNEVYASRQGYEITDGKLTPYSKADQARRAKVLAGINPETFGMST